LPLQPEYQVPIISAAICQPDRRWIGSLGFMTDGNLP